MINFNIARKFGPPLAVVGIVGLAACAETVDTQPQETQTPPAAESQQLPCEIKPSGSGLKVNFEIVKKGADFGDQTEHVFDFGDEKTGSEKGSIEDHTYATSNLYEVNAGYRNFFDPESTYYACTPIAVYVSAGALTIKPPQSKSPKKKVTVPPSARATGFSSVVPTTASSRSSNGSSSNRPTSTTTTTTTRATTTVNKPSTTKSTNK